MHKITIKCFDDARITQIIFNRQEKTYLVIFDDGNINLFTEDGSNQEVYQCKEKIISVAYAEKYNSYVTVCRDNYLRVSIILQYSVRKELESQSPLMVRHYLPTLPTCYLIPCKIIIILIDIQPRLLHR